jgi:hypothetical protein
VKKAPNTANLIKGSQNNYILKITCKDTHLTSIRQRKNKKLRLSYSENLNFFIKEIVWLTVCFTPLVKYF